MRLLIPILFLVALSSCAPVQQQEQQRAQFAWSDAALDDLAAVAAAAPAEGLPDEDAALAELATFRQNRDADAAAAAQTTLAADALFASLARSFAQGGADPEQADPQWAIPLQPLPDLDALKAQRDSGAAPSSLLLPLLPQNAEYAALRAELARVRAEPEDAPRRETRIMQLRASLERWRWLPRQLPDPRLEVRIPQFELIAIAPDAPPQRHKVIVGARNNQTPSFIGEIGSLTFNPSWDPPPSIAAELLQRFRRNPAAAAREGFEAIDTSGIAHPASAVDWTVRPFPYRLRQRPGPANALGRIRFDMADDYAIRLHDTPDRSLFDREVRAFSHGCVRVESPETLAVRVLGSPDWTDAAVSEAIAAGVQRAVALPETLYVYLIYITASADSERAVAYADDVYQRDPRVVAALDAPDVTLARQAVAWPEECSAGVSIR